MINRIHKTKAYKKGWYAMPAITGPVQIVNIDSGIVQFGDAVFISPKSSSKSVLGQGAGNLSLIHI